MRKSSIYVIEAMNTIGIVSKSDGYGGTYIKV